MKKNKISKGKVQNMMMTGAMKTRLTFRDMMTIEEFMKAEAGLESLDAMGLCLEHGALMFENGVLYDGRLYRLVHMSLKNEIILINENGGMRIKWKPTLGYVHSRYEENGKIYDTKTAKLLNRRTVAVKEEPFDVVHLDFYITPEGRYFTHAVTIVMQHIADELVRTSGASRKAARYINTIKTVSKEEIIEEYGSLEDAWELFEEVAPQLDRTLCDYIGGACGVCQKCG